MIERPDPPEVATRAFIRQHELPVVFPVLSRSTWNRLVRSGAIPSTRIGRSVIVATDAAEAYLSGRSAG